MTSNIHWMIAAAGADAQQTRQAGFSCVHFCSRLSEEGTFSLTALPGRFPRRLSRHRGQRRHSQATAPHSRERQSAPPQNRHCAGILADFERPLLQELTACLNRETQQQNLTLFVPLPLADYAPHAQVIADTVISGGSLEEYFSNLLSRFGEHRLAAQLTCTCMDFPLPWRVSQRNSADRQAISSTADGYWFCGLFLARIMRQILYLYQRRSGAFRFI